MIRHAAGKGAAGVGFFNAPGQRLFAPMESRLLVVKMVPEKYPVAKISGLSGPNASHSGSQ